MRIRISMARYMLRPERSRFSVAHVLPQRTDLRANVVQKAARLLRHVVQSTALEAMDAAGVVGICTARRLIAKLVIDRSLRL